MLRLINFNPYRVLGVLSNSPLKERVGNQARLSAFAKVGKETTFPNDFTEVIGEKPLRTEESIMSANTSLNLDKDQLKHAFFWFIKGGPIDEIALKHLQAGNVDKAKELFQKQETFSSLVNLAVIAFLQNDIQTGFGNIAKVLHDQSLLSKLQESLGITNLVISEDELSEIVIAELLTEVPASKLLSASTSPNDRAIISRNALEGPLSVINSAISTAKAADSHDPDAQLEAGTKLMNSTKSALQEVKKIAGASSPQYQMAADSLAKQILQCGINYYNNAPEEDLDSPRKAMVLQEYALKIAVGKLTKDRCQENYDILKQAVDNMPPVAVALEARKVKDELKRFCQLPDKISHSISLLTNTKPLLQTIKTKLGVSNPFYLSLSTQVVGNALHNVIEEVNRAQNHFMAIIKAIKDSGIDPALLNYIDNEHSPAKIIDSKVKPILREAWKATILMDLFDMESDFKNDRYLPNRKSLKEMCDSLKISTSSSLTSKPNSSTYSGSSRTTSTSSNNRSSNNNNSASTGKKWYEGGCFIAIIAWIVIGLIAGAICEANDGDFSAGFCISGVIVLIFAGLFNRD